MSIFNDLEAIKAVALENAKKHNCNYSIIINNPVDGEYNEASGSTYEFVTDSYFEKERNCIVIGTTDLILADQVYLIVIKTIDGDYLLLNETGALMAFHSEEDILQKFHRYKEHFNSDESTWRASATLGILQANPTAISAPADVSELSKYLIDSRIVRISGGAIGKGYVCTAVNKDIYELKTDLNIFGELLKPLDPGESGLTAKDFEVPQEVYYWNKGSKIFEKGTVFKVGDNYVHVKFMGLSGEEKPNSEACYPRDLFHQIP